MRLPSILHANWSRNEQNETFRTPHGHVFVKFGSLKLAEGVYNHMRWATGQLLAPRGFGYKKCVVRGFVVS